MLGFEDETWVNLQPHITNTYMMKGDQKKILYNGTNRKFNAFITLLYNTNNIKFTLSKSRTSTDFINHVRRISCYVHKNNVRRFILVIDNASFHVSKRTRQFLQNQSQWLTVIFLPKRSPNLNPVEIRINRNLKKDVCANHNYVTLDNLIVTARRYLRKLGSWPKI